MFDKNKGLRTAEDLFDFLDTASLKLTQRRDQKSSICRICEMAGFAPRGLCLDVPILRETLRKIRPAAHGVGPEDLGEHPQLVPSRPCELAGVIDKVGPGQALRHVTWGPLIKALPRTRGFWRACGFLQLVRGPRDRSPKSGQRGPSRISQLARHSDALSQAARSRAPRAQPVERGEKKDRQLA